MADDKDNQKELLQAHILTRALPYMQHYSGCIMVIKYGGHAMVDEGLAVSFAHDVTLLKQVGIHPVIVHGGGPQIDELLSRLNVKTEYVSGLRKTSKETFDVVEMALMKLNKRIVTMIARSGGQSIGLSGRDGSMVTARKMEEVGDKKKIDLGFVGEPDYIDTSLFDSLRDTPFIPVVAPIAPDREGVGYNINADIFAGALAGALKARRLLLLTDVPGVLDREKNKIPVLSKEAARAMVVEGIATGGMIPKLQTCLNALEGGVEGTVILDGRPKHSLLIELFTPSGHGTLIGKPAFESPSPF